MPRTLFVATVLLLSSALSAQGELLLQRLPNTFREPVDIVSNGADDSLLFILEKSGVVNQYDLSTNSVGMVLDISQRVLNNGEAGALGMAFHPEYPDSNFVYINYTAPTTVAGGDMETRISRFTLDNAGIGLSVSERRLLTIIQPLGNHNAGDLAFGPDGYLYIPTGDGGGANDQFDNGQNATTLLGKMLRIDVDSTVGDQNYAVPPDNPFVGSSDTLPEIWALGLRNPWRISFDRQTGGLWIADVGQGAREEVNYVAPGAGGGMNFGWNCREGLIAFNGPSARCGDRGAEDFTDPVVDYAHSSSERVNGASITGGFVYRGPAEDLQGYYIFGDFVRQRIFLFPTEEENADRESIVVYDNLAPTQVSTFGEGNDGSLYVADFGGIIYRITTEEATSVRGRQVPGKMAAFPNPATDLVHLDLDNQVEGTALVTVTTVDGRRMAALRNVSVSGGRAEVSVPELPAGVYVITLELAGQGYLTRITLR